MFNNMFFGQMGAQPANGLGYGEYSRDNWSPYAKATMPQNVPGLYSGQGIFGQGPAIDPNHLAMQQRLAQMPPQGLLGSPYSFMPRMQMPGAFIPTATMMHPQMGGTTDFAANQPGGGGGTLPQQTQKKTVDKYDLVEKMTDPKLVAGNVRDKPDSLAMYRLGLMFKGLLNR